MSLQGSNNWDFASTIRPISDDFWREFSIEFSYVMWAANLGIEVLTAKKTRYLAMKVIAYAQINSNKLDVDSMQVIAFIRKCLPALNHGLFSCLEVGNGRKIGLAHLKQISLYPSITGEIGVVCAGFTNPIAQGLFFVLRNNAVEYLAPIIASIHGAFHTLLSTRQEEYPDDFTLEPNVKIDDG